MLFVPGEVVCLILGPFQIVHLEIARRIGSMADIFSTRFIFGFVLVLVDMKEPWANSFFGLQTKLFLYCNFLASQTGRACFYFYVGSISLFLLPSSETLLNCSLFFICSILWKRTGLQKAVITLPHFIAVHIAVRSYFNIVQSSRRCGWLCISSLVAGSASWVLWCWVFALASAAVEMIRPRILPQWGRPHTFRVDQLRSPWTGRGPVVSCHSGCQCWNSMLRNRTSPKQARQPETTWDSLELDRREKKTLVGSLSWVGWGDHHAR